MALGIGQNATDFARASRSEVGELARQAATTAAREVRFGGTRSGDQERPGINPSATGIDQRAVNGPAAALRTIDRGIASARQIVPDVQDILEIARERFSESEAAREARLEEQRTAANEGEEQGERTEERVLPEASRQAERFRADADAEARQAAPQDSARPTQDAPNTRQDARPALNVLV